MKENHDAIAKINEIRAAVMSSGLYSPTLFPEGGPLPAGTPETYTLERTLESATMIHSELEKIADFIRKNVIAKILELEKRLQEPEEFEELRQFLEGVLAASDDFRKEAELVPVYGDLLSLYILSLYKCGSPGRESPLIRMMLTSIARRKAIEIDHAQFEETVAHLQQNVCIAIIAKRYAVYVLATRGLEVLFRSEIEFRIHGTSPEALALQVTNVLLKHGIKLSEVTDVVCAGGDLGALPDGIYVLTDKVRDESWKRLHNSSLNRGALVTWELRQFLRSQGEADRINASVCSPLSFSTLNSHSVSSLFKEDTRELEQNLKGYVKITPLKSMAALLSEIQGINPENLNLLVMSLDELFASVARKIGPRVIRELAAQEANKTLINFDFEKILDWLKQEDFAIPPNFRLAMEETGTGAKEICELLMIIESGKVSNMLERSLMHVVDSYAKQVAMVLEMASAGDASQRPHFITINSMMALDPHFQTLFSKIRNRMDSPMTPIMCVDSLEHEYLIANHLFELYVNPEKTDRRLHYSVEEKSMKQALQILGASGKGGEIFSFPKLLDEITGLISEGTLAQANIVLVGGDNEEALGAIGNAKGFGLLNRISLIGHPEEIMGAIRRTGVQISPGEDPKVEIVPIDPLAVDFDSKQKTLAATFQQFLRDNPDFVIMKGSVDTAVILREALAVYKTEDANGGKPKKKMASHTAMFVLPDGRFLALADAAVNPGFRNGDAMLNAISNMLCVVRRIIPPPQVLKVAIITAVEKETSAIPSTLIAAEAAQKSSELEALYGPFVCEGPLSFDVSTAPEVAEEKHYQGKIQGDANCLMATDINTANVLYKTLSKTMGSLGLMIDTGGIITAGPGTAPIILVSRGDTAQTKLNSILLGLAYVSREKRGDDLEDWER